MKITFFGCGAAGNKVAINLIERGIVSTKNAYLVNSTVKDIPERYSDISLIFSSKSHGGCGKERDRGKSLLVECMKNEKINFDGLLSPNDDMVVLCSSVEGGSGSAAITVLAKYFKEVLGVKVATILLFGFEDDVRGLQNSIEVCQELSEEYSNHAISNKKFLAMANGNTIKAEKLANDEVARRVNVLIGNTISESDQNIDETDLYKLMTRPGYAAIESIDLPRIKNRQMYNSIIEEALDNSKSLDISEPTAQILGAIFTISPKTEDFVDFSSEVVKKRFGSPYEYFTHVQYTADGQENVTFVLGGMDMPIDEIKDVFRRYQEQTENVKKNKDNFFDTVNQFKGDPKDAIFNMGDSIGSGVKNPDEASKKKFFEEFKSTPPADTKFKNVKVNSDIEGKY